MQECGPGGSKLIGDACTRSQAHPRQVPAGDLGGGLGRRALARHLGEFGEIRITRTQPESVVEWEGDLASGCVRLEPSGWGTKVTLTAEPRSPSPSPSPSPSRSRSPSRRRAAKASLVEPLPAPPQRRAEAPAPEPEPEPRRRPSRRRDRPEPRAGAPSPACSTRSARRTTARSAGPDALPQSPGVSSNTERRVLTVARPGRPRPPPRGRAAGAALDPHRSRATVRQSYAEEVFGRPDEELRQQIWMLRQPKAVRESYIADVLLAPRG